MLYVHRRCDAETHSQAALLRTSICSLLVLAPMSHAHHRNSLPLLSGVEACRGTVWPRARLAGVRAVQCQALWT